MEKVVVPGAFLSREEEFVAGKNTFVSDDGKIYSDSVGVADFDTKGHEVNVSKKARIVKPLDAGSTIVGKVSLVKDNLVVVEILNAENKGEPRNASGLATIMVSRAAERYVENLRHEFRIGDIVKARVVSQNAYGAELSTVDRDLGVIMAFCTRCRQPMHLFERQLKCTNCGSAETRKIAEKYFEV